MPLSTNSPALLTVVLLLLAGCSVRPAGRATETLLPPDGVEVPLKLDNDRPLVEVLVNGQGPYRFLIDTACETVIVDRKVADACGLQRVGKEFPGNKYRAGVGDLKIGTAKFRDLDVWVFDIAGIDPVAPAVDGVLGPPIFADCCLTLDMPRERLIINRHELSAGTPHVVAMEPTQPAIVVQLGLADGSMINQKLLLATGFTGSLSLPADVRPSLGPLVEAGVLLRQTNGRRTADQIERLSSGLRLAGWTVEGAEAIFSDEPPCAGIRLLREFRLTFDWRRRLVQLVPPR